MANSSDLSPLLAGTTITWLAAACAFLALLACSRSETPASSPQQEISSPPQEICAARVDALSRHVNRFLTEPQFAFQPREAKLPQMHGRARASRDYRIFEVTATRSWLGTRQPEDASKAAAQLRSFVEQMRACASDPSEPLGLYLAADPDTPVSKIAALFAPVTNVEVLLLGRLDTGPLGPPPASGKLLADELDRASNEPELARLGARELTAQAAPCRPLAKRLAQLKYQPEDDQAALLVKSLDEGLRECQCQSVDIDALEYLVMRLLEAPSTDFGEVPLPKDKTGRLVLPTEPGLTVGGWLQRL